MKRVRGSARPEKSRSFLRVQWKRISLTVIAGMFVGFGAAAATHERVDLRAAVVSSARVPARDADEVMRLKVRNRRLEALVTVLRQRTGQ